MEFDKSRFLQTLLDLPEEKPLLDPPEHSGYLQTHVFDKLKADETFDLTALDWDAFDLRHVSLEGCGRQYEWVHEGWLCGINSFLRKTPAESLREKRFF